MSQTKAKPNQLRLFNRRQSAVSKLLNEQASRFAITPMQVLIISIVFIGVVYLEHILAKFVPANLLPQVAVAVIVVLMSLILAFAPNK